MRKIPCRLVRRLVRHLGALAFGAMAGLAHAEYPDHAIRLVVPFPPGGNVDATARIVATGLSAALGQSVVIDNRGGAAGLLGSDIVARSPPDGYTVLLASTGALAPAKALNPGMALDPVKDFTAAGPIARAPLLLVVGPSVPVKNFAEFIAYARARPGKLTVATAGTGTAAHLGGELFQSMSGTKFLHVPYKGGGQAVTDLLGGQVDLSFEQLAATLPQIRAGKLRALGVTTLQRSGAVPDLPTLAEQGLPGFEASTTTGLSFPAGTPPTVVVRMNAALRQVLDLPDTKQKFEALGSDLLEGSGEDFARIVRTEVQKWTRVVQDAGIKAE